MALSSFYDAWPVSGSRFPVLCHGLAGPQPWQQAGTDIKPAQWPAPGSRLLSSRCLSTSGYLHLRRQRQRRHRHGSHRGSICCQVWPENLRRPACWPRRRRGQQLGLIRFGAWPVSCLIPGWLNCVCMSWPDPVWSSLVLSDPVRYLACRIADWQGAASASGLRLHRGCDCVSGLKAGL